MYSSSQKAHLLRQLNKRGNSILIGGVFLFFSVLLYLALCSMPCEIEQREVERYRKHSFHGGHELSGNRHPIAPRKKLTTFLVVLILTAPKNKDQREAIRETWLSGETKQEDLLPLFVIGTKGLPAHEQDALLFENKTSGDLLLFSDFKDAYQDLTTKVLLSFQWLDGNINYKFVFKADDDTFAKIDIIATELRLIHRTRKFHWGFFDGRARVKKSGQWAEKDWILCDRYVPYARGGGYVLSSDLVCFIAENANILMKFKSEDVSVGTWLAPLDITRVHDPRFDTEYKSRGCSNKYIVTHKQSVEQMREKYRNLQEMGVMCPKEFKTMNSYIYDWNAPPSKCCIRNDNSVP